MNCGYCGAQIKDGAVFCRSCGRKIEIPVTQRAQKVLLEEEFGAKAEEMQRMCGELATAYLTGLRQKTEEVLLKDAEIGTLQVKIEQLESSIQNQQAQINNLNKTISYVEGNNQKLRSRVAELEPAAQAYAAQQALAAEKERLLTERAEQDSDRTAPNAEASPSPAAVSAAPAAVQQPKTDNDKCPVCGAEWEAGMIYCGECGAKRT